MALFELKSQSQNISLENVKEDYRTAKRAGQYRFSEQAIYFPAFPGNRYLPYDEKKEYADPGSLEQKILLQEEINNVLQAIQILPEREKDILRLKYHHGMATKEIALETGLAESTIRVLLGRARQHLKHLLYEGGAK